MKRLDHITRSIAKKEPSAPREVLRPLFGVQKGAISAIGQAPRRIFFRRRDTAPGPSKPFSAGSTYLVPICTRRFRSRSPTIEHGPFLDSRLGQRRLLRVVLEGVADKRVAAEPKASSEQAARGMPLQSIPPAIARATGLHR